MSGELFIHSGIDDAGLSPAQFRVLAHLARRAGADGVIYSAIEDMADVCRLHEKTIRPILHRLEKMSVIVTEYRAGQTPIRRINPVSKWLLDPSQKTTPPKKVEGYKNGTTPLPKNGRRPLPKTFTQRVSSEGNPKKAIQSLAGFAEFYAAYPKKKSRGAAEKAWKKIANPTETLPLILAALEWQTKQPRWKEDDGKWIPYPASWLNARGWEDEPIDSQRHSFNPVPQVWEGGLEKMRTRLAPFIGGAFDNSVRQIVLDHIRDIEEGGSLAAARLAQWGEWITCAVQEITGTPTVDRAPFPGPSGAAQQRGSLDFYPSSRAILTPDRTAFGTADCSPPEGVE